MCCSATPLPTDIASGLPERPISLCTLRNYQWFPRLSPSQQVSLCLIGLDWKQTQRVSPCSAGIALRAIKRPYSAQVAILQLRAWFLLVEFSPQFVASTWPYFSSIRNRKELRVNTESLMMFDNWKSWFHSSRVTDSSVRNSASWSLVSTYLTWTLGSRFIRSNSQLKAT